MRKFSMHFKTAIVILAAVMSVMSCTDPVDEITPPETDDPTLSTDAPSEIIFQADGTGGMSVITVTTNQDSWGHEVDPSDGHGWLNVLVEGDKINLTALPSETEEPREDVILTITAGEATPVEITVKQEAYVAPPVFEGTVYNLEGLTGDITVTYFDGTTTTATIEEGVAKVDKTDSKWIYSITSDTAGEVLIGRLNNQTISLKFVDGALTHREAVNGKTPVGSYAEFALINTDDNTLYGNYAQEADLDLLGSEDLEAAGLVRQNWTQIGQALWDWMGDTIIAFTGSFDGQDFTINNIYSYDVHEDGEIPYNMTVGLFGCADGAATFSNIHIASGSITSIKYAGGICAMLAGNITNVTNCSNGADVWGYEQAGGISGNCGGTIELCYNTGNIIAGVEYGNGYGGGIAGFTESHIELCYNTGYVKADPAANMAYLGGIAGGGNPDVVACYNTGTIEDFCGFSAYTAGIVGENNGSITACYNTGAVKSTAEMGSTGGIAGSNNDYGNSNSIKACYNTGTVSAPASNQAGGITGYNNALITASFYLADNGVTKGVGGDWGDVKQEANCLTFSATSWPGVGSAPDGGGWIDSGWGTGSGATNNWWASLGSWTSGGNPNGINSAFPTLWWEE